MSEPIRIQKWISQLGLASRREAETWILDGRVAINGTVVTELGTKADPDSDSIAIDGKPVTRTAPPRVYWLLHKPDMTLTARPNEEDDRDSIYDLPRMKGVPFKIDPIGRLDYRTEGLLLMTNDGELAHRFMHPSYQVPRRYHVLVKNKLTTDQEKDLRKGGVRLEDGPSPPAELVYAHGKNLGKSRGSWYEITLREGRNRIVRRIFEHFGCPVVKLMRVSFGPIRLPEDLEPGDYIQLNKDQIKAMKKAVKLES